MTPCCVGCPTTEISRSVWFIHRSKVHSCASSASSRASARARAAPQPGGRVAGARKRRVRGRFYSVLDAVKGVLVDAEPRVRECERRRTERIERREVVRDLDHGHDGHDQRPSSNSRSIRRFSDATKLGGGRAAPYRRSSITISRTFFSRAGAGAGAAATATAAATSAARSMSLSTRVERRGGGWWGQRRRWWGQRRRF